MGNDYIGKLVIPRKMVDSFIQIIQQRCPRIVADKTIKPYKFEYAMDYIAEWSEKILFYNTANPSQQREIYRVLLYARELLLNLQFERVSYDYPEQDIQIVGKIDNNRYSIEMAVDCNRELNVKVTTVHDSRR